MSEKQLEANRKNAKSAGRPRWAMTEKEWTLFDAMCSAGALEIDIAEAFRVEWKTINAMLKRERMMDFSHYRKQKMGRGRANLAAVMYDAAMKGNTTMQIFLSKKWLGMSDRQSVDTTVRTSNVVVYLPDNGRQ